MYRFWADTLDSGKMMQHYVDVPLFDLPGENPQAPSSLRSNLLHLRMCGQNKVEASPAIWGVPQGKANRHKRKQAGELNILGRPIL